jgi:DinB superfamily
MSRVPAMRLRPATDEYASSFQVYVQRVPDGDVLQHLRAQGERTLAMFAQVDEAKGGFRYAPEKWTVKRLLLHVADGERLFCYRAMCVARGEQASLPGFDENVYAANDGSDGRRLRDVVAEFASVRAATLTLFSGFDDAAWQRRGIANGKLVTVRALPWIIAGHELHHLAVLRERYGIPAS